jgi:hypothetical protein
MQQAYDGSAYHDPHKIRKGIRFINLLSNVGRYTVHSLLTKH